jgi:hypothetical protein
MSVPYIFCPGEVANPYHVNANFAAVDNAETVLENSINIVKLQYCASVTDVDHDYMVVDVFTDSNGYNNTLCLTDTTSTYCPSALNGYYLNYSNTICTVGSLTSTYLGCGGNATSKCIEYGNNFICGNFNNAPTYCYPNLVGCMCLDFNDCLSDYKDICLCFNLFRKNSGSGGHYSFYSFTFCNGVGSGIVCSWSNVCTVNTTHTVCLLWRYDSGNKYDFYVDGVCTGNTCMDSFCKLGYCIGLCATNACFSPTCGCVSLVGLSFLKFDETKLKTVPIEYSNPTQSSYLTLDKSGAGTILYNVYNAVNNCKIGDNLQLNTHNLLTDCVQCHYYEIIQCSDAVSCIKSYAVLAGEV